MRVELAGLAPRGDVPGDVRRRTGEDCREPVAEEVLDHPDVQVQAKRLRPVLAVEPYPRPVEVDREIDPDEVEGVAEDEGIQRRLDPVTDAEVLARLDVDDLEDLPLLAEPDEVGAAGGEPVQVRSEAVIAEEVDRDRDGRLVDRLPRREAGEDLETLLDRERPAGEGACPLRDAHPPGKPGPDDLLLPPDSRLEEGLRHRAPVRRDRRDPGRLALLLRGRVIAEIAFAVVVEVPADERGAEVEAGHGRIPSGL